VNIISIGPDQVTALAKWSDTDKYDLSSLWFIIVGGSRPSPAMVQLAEKRMKKKIVSGYGMTECMSGFEPPLGATNKDGSVGKPSANSKAKVSRHK
jgi:acyl-coenzyme A synthetase/AMP-(fatty) acid ligase